jgi:MFS family permease
LTLQWPKTNIGKLYAYQFCTGLHLITGVLVPFFTEYGGMSFAKTMMLQGWFFFWLLMLEIPTGIVADVQGRCFSLVVGSIAFLCGITAFVSIAHWSVFFLGMFLWAFGLALVSGADESLMYESMMQEGSQVQKDRVMSRFVSFHFAGWAIGAPLASILTNWIALRDVVACMFIPFGVALLIACTLREPPRKKVSYRRMGAVYRGTLSAAWNHICATRSLRLLGINQIVVGSMLFVAMWTHQRLMQTLLVPTAWFGLVQTGILGFGSLIAFFALHRVLSSQRDYLFLSACVPAISIGMFGFVASPPLVMFLAVYGIGIGFARFGPIIHALHQFVPLSSQERATTMSLLNMGRSAVSVVGMIGAGMIAQWSLAATFYLIGLVMAIAAVALAVLLKEKNLYVNPS